MDNRWLKSLLSAALALIATSWLSCGQDHKLVAIEIQPSGGFKFRTPDPSVKGVFTAIGTYVHPPGTADITSKVTWKTDVPQLLVINNGVVSPQPGNVCGVADVYANMNSGGNFVTANATVTVNDSTNVLCPGGSTTQGVVSVTVIGTGSVTSAPAGITCPSAACIAQFPAGQTMGLNAMPASGTSVTWAGCTKVNGNTCSVLVTTGSTDLTATFN
jgi:hypothetical protein